MYSYFPDSLKSLINKDIIFDFNNTVSKDYPSLNEEQNFLKNKIILKLDMIKKNILSNASNRFLIQTVGNAFSSLEFTHYQDIPSASFPHILPQ